MVTGENSSVLQSIGAISLEKSAVNAKSARGTAALALTKIGKFMREADSRTTDRPAVTIAIFYRDQALRRVP